MASKSGAPIGFGRTPMPDAAGNDSPAGEGPAAEQSAAPPLAAPVFVDDVAMLAFFARYNLHPLTPPGKFEYQLVCIAAGLEQRIRELDPDA